MMYKTLKMILLGKTRQHINNCKDVNMAYSIFHNLFNNVCNKHAPIKEKRSCKGRAY